MARPPKYASEEDKPVSVTLRLPRNLYDQAQQHAKRRQTTLTELVREGLQMRLETPTDPRDILATQDSTVMQEVRQMIADEVQAALAAQRTRAPDPSPPTPAPHNGHTAHYSNAVCAPEDEDEHGHSLVTEGTAPPSPRRAHKLTSRQIRALRDKHLRGVPVPALMEEYGISRASVFRYLQSDKR
jgi:hypothetical protein